MRTVLLASLRHNTRRYVSSALAVLIGVAFIVATDGLSGSLRSGATADVGRPYQGGELFVESYDTEAIDGLVSDADVPAVPVASAYDTVAVPGRTGDPATIGVVADDEALRWQELVEGEFPTAPGQVLLDERTVERTKASVGDTIMIGTVESTVVGVADAASAGGSAAYVTWAQLRDFDSTWVSGAVWNGTRAQAEAAVPDGRVVTVEQYVEELQTQIAREVNYLALFVLIFAALALGVAVLVITNTFAILFAQRARDFALLRCVGVTRAQVRRSVRVEALVLGVVASLVGLGTGALAAYGLAAAVRTQFEAMGPVEFNPLWLAGAFVLGVLVTLVAAWLPTRAVTRVSPLAAMRPAEGLDVRSRAGRFRIAAGAVVAAAGAALLVAAPMIGEVSTGVLVMLGAGAVSFTGVILLGPVLVPALLRLIGGVVGRFGGRGSLASLATANAVRNPRRTATTAASLLVGVTLTTAVLTGLASSRTVMNDEMREMYPLDMSVSAAAGKSLPADALDAIGRADGVDVAESVETVTTTVQGHEGDVRVIGAPEQSSVLFTQWPPSEDVDVLVPEEVAGALTGPAKRQWNEDSTITFDGVDGPVELRAGVSDMFGSSAVLSRAALDELGTPAAGQVVWVRADRGADAGDLETALLAAADGAEVSGTYGQRAWIDTQLDVMTGAVVGLLAVAVVIALIGIGNTLGLSVLERSRENALLRAMGLTRRQLRRTLAAEGALLAGVAAILGLALGLVYAFVGVEVLIGGVVEDVSLSLPWVQLVVIVVVAALSGVLASVLPSRRAARVTPAAGLALD